MSGGEVLDELLHLGLHVIYRSAAGFLNGRLDVCIKYMILTTNFIISNSKFINFNENRDRIDKCPEQIVEIATLLMAGSLRAAAARAPREQRAHQRQARTFMQAERHQAPSPALRYGQAALPAAGRITRLLLPPGRPKSSFSSREFS